MKKLIIFSFLVGALLGCNKKRTEQIIFGEAQGTTYSIKYISETEQISKTQIDSILTAFDFSLSTYNPQSLISKFNACEKELIYYPWQDEFLEIVFEQSKEVNRRTHGAFNPGIMPLVNYWGFGYDTSKFNGIDSMEISKRLNLTNFNNFKLGRESVTKDGNSEETIELHLTKTNPEMELDFNAIAQGYSVDVLADFLTGNNINNFMVEIGGEVVVRGKNRFDKHWTVGVDKPVNQLDRSLNAILSLEDCAVVTSGNYRKSFEFEGKKYAHTINPKTGYPVLNDLLSATVVANTCATADAYATAFMVMGKNETLRFLQKNEDLNLNIYLIYSGEKGNLKTYISKPLENKLEEDVN